MSVEKPGSRRIAIGRWGESLAAGFLESLGYQILERNFRTPYGEIDLIASYGQLTDRTIVFVEVKTRRSKSFGQPEDSIGPRKRTHLLEAAAYYIQQSPDTTSAWRVDVIAIEQSVRGGAPNITHFENVFS